MALTEQGLLGIPGAQYGLIRSENSDWEPKHGDVVQEESTGRLFQVFELRGTLAYFPLDSNTNAPAFARLPELVELISSARDYIEMAEKYRES